MLGGEQKRAQGPQKAIMWTAHRDSEKVLDFVQHPTCDYLQKSPCQKGRDRPSTFKRFLPVRQKMQRTIITGGSNRNVLYKAGNSNRSLSGSCKLLGDAHFCAGCQQLKTNKKPPHFLSMLCSHPIYSSSA